MFSKLQQRLYQAKIIIIKKLKPKVPFKIKNWTKVVGTDV
jgi:hypothetical protein